MSMVECTEGRGRDDGPGPLLRTSACGWFERERSVWTRVVELDDVLPTTPFACGVWIGVSTVSIPTSIS